VASSKEVTDALGESNSKGIVMGMDIYGRHLTSEAGKYFRANVWSWRPIHALIEQECADVLDVEMLRQLGFMTALGDGSMCASSK
jgi:hypothetical protein